MSREHCTKILGTLNDHRKEAILCDVTLHVQNCSYPAHRSILSANSPYFYKLFTSDMTEKAQNTIKVDLEELEIGPTVMDDILRYFYTGNLNIYTSTAQDLLVASDYFLISDLKEAVAEYMASMITIENCLVTQALAERFNSQHLHKTAKLFIEKHFSLVCRTTEFLELPLPHLIELLSNDDLVLHHEKEALDAVFSWVNYSRLDREKHFDRIFPQIRLVSFTTLELNELQGNKLMRDNAKCIDLIDQLLESRANNNVGEEWNDPRKCLQPPLEVIVTCGGMSPQFPDHCPLTRCYVPDTNNWYELKPMSYKRNWHGFTSCGDAMYCIGGEVDGTVTSSCQRYDFIKNTWEDIAPLLRLTIFPAVAELKGKLYVIGGVRNNRARLQIYNPETDAWSYGTCLNFAREITCAVAKGPYIYAIGGLQSDIGTYMNSVEKYHPDFDCWITVRSMIHSRAGATGVALNNCIYVIGGEHDLRMAHNSCEMYFIAYDEWQDVASMRVPRYFAGAAVVGQGFFVFGGVGGTNVDYLDKQVVEYYDAKADTWKSDFKMPWSERYFRCAKILARKHLLRGLSVIDTKD